MIEFTEKMKADHDEALRINADMTAKAQTENAVLREVLAKIGGFAHDWKSQVQYASSAWASERFNIIEQTCKSALEQPAPPQAPLTYVMVGGAIYAGTLIDDNPEDFEGCVEIEVMDIDPTCARMRVIGTPTGKINEAPETVVEVS